MGKSTNLYDSVEPNVKENKDEFHAELEKGYADIEKGNVTPAKESLTALRGELGIVTKSSTAQTSTLHENKKSVQTRF